MTPSVSLAENSAVLDPRRALTRMQREALLAIGLYRRHRLVTGAWLIGDRRFSTATLKALSRAGLIRLTGHGFALTQGGTVALLKLKGKDA